LKRKPDLNPVSSHAASKVNEPGVQITGERTLRAILSEGEGSAMIMTDPTGLVISWNKAAESIFGYTENEITGKSIACFYLPGTIESGEHSDNLQQAAQSPGYFAEGWRVKKDGTKFWAYIEYTALYDFNRRLLGFANTIRELTENKHITEDDIEYSARSNYNGRVKAFEKKITSDTRFRKLIENSYEGITLLDKDFKTIFRSRSAKRINGWSNAERTKQSMIDRVHPDEKEWMASLLKKVLKSPGTTIPCIFRTTHFDGHYIWLQSAFTNYLDDPEIEAIVFNFRDITGEKELQIKEQRLVKELKERNSFIETILENLPIGIAVNRIDDGKTTIVNKNFSEIYGWSEKDLNDVNAFFSKVYPDETYRNRIVGQVMEDINSGDPARMVWKDMIITTKKGKNRVINSKNIPLYDQNLMISTVTDVTDEYNQSNELKRIKANQDAIINGTENLVWSVDADLRIISANKHYVEFVKANTGQYISEGDIALTKGYGEERLARWRDYYERALFGEILTFKEEIFDHRTNRVQYGLVSLNPMYNTEGKIFGVSCNIKNITEDTLNLMALERAKNDLEKIMNASLDIICTIDARGNFLSINSAAETILGYKPEELIGTSVFAIIHPDDREKTKIASAGLMAGRDLINYECRYLRKDDSIVYLTSSSKWDPSDRVSYGVAMDATEYKKIIAELAESEKKYSELFHLSPMPICVYELGTLNILDVNEAAIETFGYSREEFLSISLKSLALPEEIPMILESIIEQ
jgi:PAS domain S-box-containing protein